MSYIVLTRFADIQDRNHIYEAGGDYPRPGYTPTPNRVAELAGNSNKQGKPLIVNFDAPCDECAVEAPEKPVEAPHDEPKEIPAESVEAPAKGRRSRKKG